MASLPPIPVVVGPTAGGKTALAVTLAESLGRRPPNSGEDPRIGEVITCDAFQVYRGLDIGTAKPTETERRGVPHHLIDLVEPTEAYSAARWLEDARGVIADLDGRGVRGVVAGGTHLFVKALLDGLFEGPGADEALRTELRGLGLSALREELRRVDPDAAARIHPNDERRTVRALEVFRLTGTPISEHQRQWDAGREPSRFVLIGLVWPADAVASRINARVRDMVERGLVDEARGMWDAGRLGPRAREALGYKQLIEHFEGHCSLEDAIEKTKIETRRFAKNQRTWLRRLRTTPGSIWLEAEGRSTRELAEEAMSLIAAGPSA
ncbi:MAG: tRNA (adenosine(37)-N6)-dimethylallyltransferase MiaA [Planctomycetota bacterium]